MELRHIRLAYNNVYLLAGSDGGAVLIDTGPDYRGAREALLDGLGGRAPALVIATHGHQDHAGLGRWWQAREVPVLLGEADLVMARHPHATDDGEFAALRAWVEGTGAPAEVVAEAVAGIERRRAWARRVLESTDYPPPGSQPRWPSGLRYEPFAAEPVVGDAELLGVQVLSCPGHTPGNLVVVEPEEGWLFSGDQLLTEITPTPGIQFLRAGEGWRRFPSLPAFAASLRRLRERGFTMCYPGHGEPFAGVDDAIAANLSAIESRTERVYQELREGGPATLFGLAERLYPRALRRRFWQIAATVQGHLDLLTADGRVAEGEGGYEACG